MIASGCGWNVLLRVELQPFPTSRQLFKTLFGNAKVTQAAGDASQARYRVDDGSMKPAAPAWRISKRSTSLLHLSRLVLIHVLGFGWKRMISSFQTRKTGTRNKSKIPTMPIPLSIQPLHT